ncbi:hypothetical protein [Salinisphaera sp. G21_0]|uniref:hypothetical protein n=1 Tax=Salinisphaera sp. G21_0 TaxID=2821094 RepID=UPI001ADAC769|nr:hypothetical protein [Salinisphaera sp. G21_0]MBO9484595.1 hypothetical protein [Salinisphaera sp. G21_0]
MATTNIWQQFKALIPEGVRIVATITANNGNGTSQATLRDGSVITVKGGAVSSGQKVFIQDGEIKDTAPSLAQYEVEV